MSEGSSETIKKLLKETGLFNDFNEDILLKICTNLVQVNFDAGEIIINEGELGDAFYIIEKGAVRVFTQNDEGNEIVLARLEKGNYFGEQALLSEMPKLRNASVKSLDNVTLLKISQALLQDLLKENQTLRKVLTSIGKKQFLEKLTHQLSAFGNLKENLIKLADQPFHEFKDEEVIFNEGDIADYVYFIMEGKVSIKINKPLKNQLVVLGPGHMFGEVGVLENKFRNGSARAVGSVKVIGVSADKFRQFYAENSELKSWVTALKNIYQIHGRGIITQYLGKFQGSEAINSIFELDNGEMILASRVIEYDLFSIMRMNVKNSHTLRFEEGSIWREAYIADGKLAGITNYGQWEDLGTVSAMVLDNTPINPQREQSFLKTGMFSDTGSVMPSAPIQTPDDQVICECMVVTRGEIQQAIQSGATQIDEVSEKTGAGTVCGACRQKLADMLGRAVWFPAILSLTQEHNNVIRTYTLEPNNCQFPKSKPGQYVIIQAQINRNWVERVYTLTSLPDHKNFQITVKCEPLGLFSQWLFNQRQEVPLVRVSPPMGDFLFDTKTASPAICFAGGIGIAPILAFVRHMEIVKSLRRMHIEYCVVSENDFVFKDEIETIIKTNPNISIHLRASDKEGLITPKNIVDLVSNFTDPDIYICGPEGFEKVVLEGAKTLNINNKRLHIEQFVHAGGPKQGGSNA